MPLTASGILCFGPSTLASIALILSIFANGRCNLVKPSVFDLPFFPNTPNSAESIGLWCYEAKNGYLYSANIGTTDSKFEAARALGTTTLVFGWFIFIFYVVAGCKRFPPGAFKVIGIFGTLTCIFQGLVFLIFQSDICDIGCDLDTGGKCGIAACVFWFLAGQTSLAAGKEAEEEAAGGGSPVEEAAPEVSESKA